MKRQQDLIQKSISFESCYHMNYCLQNYTTYQFTYLFHIYFKTSSKIQTFKIQQVHQKLHTKNFIYIFNLFPICNSFEFKVTREVRLI